MDKRFSGTVSQQHYKLERLLVPRQLMLYLETDLNPLNSSTKIPLNLVKALRLDESWSYQKLILGNSISDWQMLTEVWMKIVDALAIEIK